MQDFTLENYIPQLSIDCVIFGFSNKKLFVLLPQLESEHQIWALPGGFIKQDENIEEAAQRILKERTNLEAIYLEQFAVFGHKNRINNLFLERENQEKIHYLDTLTLTPSQQEWLSKRFVSIGYFALVDMHKVNPQKGMLDESIHWVALPEIPQLIIDHNQMIDLALKRLRERIDDNLLAFNLLPPRFTMKELQELYETVFDKPFARNNFQKKILDLDVLERLEKKYTGAANKAPYLYRFKRKFFE